MTPERQQELLAAIASAEPEFFAVIEESERTLLRLLAGEHSSAAAEVAKGAIDRLNSIVKGQAQVLGVLGGRRVPVSPSPDVILRAGAAILELMASLEAADAEPRCRS